jgi:hypothetical protein
MKHNWQVSRQFQSRPNAAERWDQAYQCLLRWTITPSATPQANDVCSAPEQEANHAHSRLRTCFDPTTSPESKH